VEGSLTIGRREIGCGAERGYRMGWGMRNVSASSVRWLRTLLTAAAVVLLAGTITAGAALACSPPFGEPSVTSLREGAVVVVGTTGDTAIGGRLFYVERVYSGDVSASPIVIAFKEGEPVGDCSYPMSSGVHLVIAPDQEADGTWRADLGTLQADPNSDLGRRFVAQARARYGDGVVPISRQAPAGTELRLVGLALALVGGAAAVWFVQRHAGRRGWKGR
jgi:hypothetical protein